MKGQMMTLASLCLLFFWMLPADSEVIYLSMAEEAVDDMFFGCKEKMAKMLKEKYFGNEITGDFGEVWENTGNRDGIISQIIDGFIRMFTQNKALTEDHKKAVLLYTQDWGKWYKKLNVKVQSSRADYGTNRFPYHYFHFWLTSAIQNLNNMDAKCFTSYRRSEDTSNGEVNQIFRFGAFTSSSLRKTLISFGSETCFKIKTCLGAFLGSHSQFPDEQEVLIPPYEMFTITEKIEGESVESIDGLRDCKVLYVLETAGVHSNLNCKLSQGE